MDLAESVAAQMAGKLARRCPLDAADRAAIAQLPYTLRLVDPASYLVREGEQPRRCPFIVAGFADRQKLTSDGARQIIAIQIPGDFTDLQNLFLRESDHNVQALTRATIAEIPIDALRELVLSRPTVAKAMWIDALIDASIFREWIVNVGRRDARARIAHILCELAVRLDEAGIGHEHRYELPMTQEQLADAVGLTPVHVNRVLKSLTLDGLIERNKRHISVGDWNRLKNVGDFSERYLHLKQAQEVLL